MGFALLLEYWQHSYENTVHTFQISSQLAKKSKRYDTFQAKNVRAAENLQRAKVRVKFQDITTI